MTEPDRLLAELCTLIVRHLGCDHDIVGLQLFATYEAGEPTASVAEASIAFVAQGAKQIAVGDHVVDYGPGDYLVVSVDLPVTGRFVHASPQEPFLGLGMTLDPTVIAELTVDGVPARRTTQPALAASAASTEMLDALVRLLRLLDEPRDRAVLAPLVQREIVWRLLCGPHAQLIHAIGLHGSSLARIGQAVRWIRSNYADPFRVEDLARTSAMSPSNFHRHFRSATTMGPIQYQKKIRLRQARLLLLGSSHDVTRVAHTVGYESASQFSREYRREFGISPSTTKEQQPQAAFSSSSSVRLASGPPR